MTTATPAQTDIRRGLAGVVADTTEISTVTLSGTKIFSPSRILSSACWTPSPDTSRVIDGLSALRAILSTSSM